MNYRTIEICANSAESAARAQQGGAARVELCAGIPEGGTTPSCGEIMAARRLLTSTRLNVIIRPRGGDFLYSPLEEEIMAHDIDTARQLGADGVVIGCLKADGSIDVEMAARLMEHATGMSDTFHRAFDMVRDPQRALEALIACGCRRVLTSGGRNTALEGIEQLRALVARAAGRIEVMAGSGVNASNARLLAATGVDALHFSARRSRESAMRYRNPAVSMGGCAEVPEYVVTDADEELVRQILTQLEP